MWIAIAACAALLLGSISAVARDDGRYARNPLHDWFDSLMSGGGGLCCADADGAVVRDPDWSAQGEGQECQHTTGGNEGSNYEGHYCVRFRNVWWLVPDKAVVIVPNKFGAAMLWAVCKNGAITGADECKEPTSELAFIRCFMPGAGT